VFYNKYFCFVHFEYSSFSSLHLDVTIGEATRFKKKSENIVQVKGSVRTRDF